MSLQTKKWIGANQIDGGKIRLLQSQALRLQRADNSDLSLLSIDANDKVNLGAHLYQATDPTDASHLARKGYVDSEVTAAKSYADGIVGTEATARSDADATFLKLDGTRRMTGTLEPTPSDTLHLGSTFQRWQRVVANLLSSSTAGGAYIDLNNFDVKSQIGYTTINLHNAELRGNGGTAAVQPYYRYLVGADGTTTRLAWGSDATTLSAQNAGNVVLKGAAIDVDSKKIINVASGTVSTDAVNKGQLDTVETGLQSQISAIGTGTEWRPGAKVATGDADILAAANGDALSTFLPFSDDDAPQMVIGDFADGDYILIKAGASSRVLKVYDDAGTLKVTAAGVVALAASHTFVVKNDLPDTPANQEGSAIYTFNGTDLIKIGDFDWSVATGIDLSSGYAVGSDVAVAVSDSLEVAIGKLEAQIGGVKAAKLDKTALDPETIKMNVDSQIEGLKDKKEKFILSAGDITNGYIDMAQVASLDSIEFNVVGAGPLFEDAAQDYSVSYTGGAGGKTRITWLNGLIPAGVSELVEGDIVFVKYRYL